MGIDRDTDLWMSSDELPAVGKILHSAAQPTTAHSTGLYLCDVGIYTHSHSTPKSV